MTFTTTPTSTTELDANEFPVSAGYVPNTADGSLTAHQAGTPSTDSYGRTSAPAMAQLAPGSAVIGHVIIDSAGSVSITSLPALPAGTNLIGHVIVDSAGSVSITSLPSLPAGTNVIGHVIVDSASSVAVTSLPSIPAGTNVIGHVIVDSAGSVSVTSLPSLPAGTNVIGHVIVDSASSVAVSSLPALPAGSNSIGSVTANAGTNLNTSALALETGGNLATIASSVGKIPAASTALTSYGSNPSQTAAAGADTQYKFGSSGTTSFTHVMGQNNTTQDIRLAFDTSTTVSGHMVYTIAAGQFFSFDRAGTVVHFSSPNQQTFGGIAGITVEAFA